ncbi:MAG TPA: signal recognition particle protein Srp19 [Thermoplasmata archaeon]|jgi:signal recognition particle subunit SRP19|nr:MAG TPA: signal recognition particle protein Srp19 [Thermoplasmata archaeon]
MVARDDNKYVIYPVYFDRDVSRLRGRKVPQKHAVEKPTLEKIAKAAQSLGLHPVLEKDAFHSSAPWRKEGRILIEKKGPKTKLLLQLSNRL